MSYKSILLFCGLMSLAPCTGASAPAAIEISVSGVSVCKGNLMLAVYGNPADFMRLERALAKKVIGLAIGECGATVRYRIDAPLGQYAVVVFHDANSNGVLDKNMLGAPIEAWGVSNNARPFLREPRFDECVFSHAAPLTVVAIAVQ